MTADADLTHALLQRIRDDCLDAHARTLTLVQDLTDEQFRHRQGAHAPSIAFHVWHLARWADHDVELFAGAPQIWRTRRLAAAWGFRSAGLGEDETGTEMGDDASDLLVFPDKGALLDYAGAALGAVDALVERLTAGAATQPVAPERITSLFAYLTHDNRHLGMIEALLGVMGVNGTATR